MWTIFKVITEFVTVLLLFYVFVFWLQGVWDLSFLIRDQPCTPSCTGRWSLDHWTTREGPESGHFKLKKSNFSMLFLCSIKTIQLYSYLPIRIAVYDSNWSYKIHFSNINAVTKWSGKSYTIIKAVKITNIFISNCFDKIRITKIYIIVICKYDNSRNKNPFPYFSWWITDSW